MIGYATIGTNNLERATQFYDKVLEPLGGKRAFANDHMQFYMGGAGPGMLAVCTPHDEKPATVGNGSMFGRPPAASRSTPPMPRRSPPAAPARASRAFALRTSMAPISATWTATSSASSRWAEWPGLS